ncbi:MAG: hypothetical protein COA86_15180 [Kangiella sp.]|nr:MAG: hypothetical protein COA86_15180 [Kangiella sp.]
MNFQIAGINIFLICLLFLWQGVQVTIADGLDGAGRLVTLLALILLFINLFFNSHYRKQFIEKNSIIRIGLFWCVYAVLNSAIKYNSDEVSTFTFISINLVIPFILMSSLSALRVESIMLLLKCLKYTVYVVCLLMFIYADVVNGRLNVSLIDPNELSLIVYLLIILITISYLLRQQTVMQTVLLLLPPLYFSVQIGSRMGVVGTGMLLIGLFFVTRNKVISFKRVVVLIPIAIIVLTYILNQTVVGERLLNSSEESQQLTDQSAEGTIFEYYGDRGLYYIIGWQAFLDEPATGIGLRNFQYNYYATVLHPEVMIQLAELGLIGIFIYIAFQSKVIVAIFSLRQRKSNISILYNYFPFIVAVLFFSSTTLFLYSSYSIAIIYGLMILFLKNETADFIQVEGR